MHTSSHFAVSTFDDKKLRRLMSIWAILLSEDGLAEKKFRHAHDAVMTGTRKARLCKTFALGMFKLGFRLHAPVEIAVDKYQLCTWSILIRVAQGGRWLCASKLLHRRPRNR